MSLRETAGKRFGYVVLTTVTFLVLNRINELMFIQFEQSAGVNWVFIPAGIRLLATLLFGFAGFVGLLLASLYLNFFHFVFETEFRALSGALAGSLAPYLAYLFAKHWFFLGPRLEGLTVPRLLFTALLCGLLSPIVHHAFMWVQSGTVDWFALMVMIIGDVVGILIVLFSAKGLLALADRHQPAARFLRRWLP